MSLVFVLGDGLVERRLVLLQVEVKNLVHIDVDAHGAPPCALMVRLVPKAVLLTSSKTSIRVHSITDSRHDSDGPEHLRIVPRREHAGYRLFEGWCSY